MSASQPRSDDAHDGPDRSVVDDLKDVTAALEAVTWGEVPGVSVETAATFARRVRDARERAAGGDR